MSEWEELSKLELDGRLVEYKFRNGSVSVGPALKMRPLSRQQRLEFAKIGEWPSACFVAEGWRELVEIQEHRAT